MPSAVRVNPNHIKGLRKMCKIRGIKFDYRQKSEVLQEKIARWEQEHVAPDDPVAPAVEVETGNAFNTPTPPPVEKTRPMRAEKFTQPKREIPPDVAEALKYLGSFSIGRTNRVARYIDTLL